MILLVDNYDSFVYNLYQLIGSINTEIKVIRNDEINIEQIKNEIQVILCYLQGQENLVKLEFAVKL